MADQQVKITISAIDNATKALNDVKNSLKGVSKETDTTGQSFFTLKNIVIGFATVTAVTLLTLLVTGVKPVNGAVPLNVQFTLLVALPPGIT